MSDCLEITGKFLKERFRFKSRSPDEPDTIIADILCNGHSLTNGSSNPPEASGRIAIKGPDDGNGLAKDVHYRFFGKWANYRNKRTKETERQFAFETFVKLMPVDRGAVVGYLEQHGKGHGFGKRRASSLWQQFGDQAIEIARTDPKRVSEFLSSSGLRFSQENAEQLSKSLEREHHIEAIKIELTSVLTGRGFPKSITDRVIQEWGNKAPMILKRDPFRLLKFPGCGFRRCDAMYLDLGLNPARMKRQALCAWYSMNRDTDGHTWFDWRTPNAFVQSSISGADANTDRALELATRGRIVDEIRTDGRDGAIRIGAGGDSRWFAEADKAKNERTIANVVASSLAEKFTWPDLSGLNLTDHQKTIASSALGGAICILGGSPGTGKTWLLSELVIACAAKVGLNNIIIGAPTGKAAVRVSENLDAKGIKLRARTWHSLLMQIQDKKHGGKFTEKVLIGDESSMLDTDLLAEIMAAKRRGTQILLVGDVNQLPPVGHGAPLRDMIAAGVPYGELKEIIRNSGGIAETCAAIRDCKPWPMDEQTPAERAASKSNLFLVEASHAAGSISHFERINQIIQMALADGLDPVWDLQIVTAVNEKSKLSRIELNQYLQGVLNNQPGEGNGKFRTGDKLVNTKNGYFRSLIDGDDLETNDRDEVYVANGELANVEDCDRAGMILSLSSPKRTIEIRFNQEGGCPFELGYALSVHKSQGSDWPWVAVVLDDYPGARMVCDRSWVYTAISRAKEKCWLVGERNVAHRFCKVSKIWHRKTFLRELILRERAKSLLGGI